MDWIIWVIVGLIGLSVFGFMGLANDSQARAGLADLLREHSGDGEILCKKPQIGHPIGLALRQQEFFVGAGDAVVQFPASAIIEVTIQTDGQR